MYVCMYVCMYVYINVADAVITYLRLPTCLPTSSSLSYLPTYLEDIAILHHVIQLIDLLLQHPMVVEVALRNLPPLVFPLQLVHPFCTLEPFVVVLGLLVGR